MNIESGVELFSTCPVWHSLLNLMSVTAGMSALLDLRRLVKVIAPHAVMIDNTHKRREPLRNAVRVTWSWVRRLQY